MDLLESPASGQDSRRLCLDFVNTLLWHASPHPEETLHTYPDLVMWAKDKGFISEQRSEEVLNKAANRPLQASQTLEQAIAFREIIYRILVAVIKKERLPEADLKELNRKFAGWTHGAGIVETASGFAWKWNVDEQALDSILQPIALSTVELLTSEDRKRLGQCADENGCGWLFLDQSKNHSRRWCDIRDCGNRAKQRRHYQREHQRTKSGI